MRIEKAEDFFSFFEKGDVFFAVDDHNGGPPSTVSVYRFMGYESIYGQQKPMFAMVNFEKHVFFMDLDNMLTDPWCIFSEYPEARAYLQELREQFGEWQAQASEARRRSIHHLDFVTGVSEDINKFCSNK